MTPVALQASPLGEVNTTSSTNPEANSKPSSLDMVMSAHRAASSTPTMDHAPPLSKNASNQEPSYPTALNAPPPTYLAATTSPVDVAYEVYPTVSPRKNVFSRIFTKRVTQTNDIEFGPTDQYIQNSTEYSGTGGAKYFLVYCVLCVIIMGTFAGYMIQATLMKETGGKSDE
jgi:hypothetical protein